MTWNHRVIRRTYPSGEVFFGIHEVFTDSEGISCTVDPVEVAGESIEELRQTLTWMFNALAKPVLDYEVDFPGGVP